MKNFMIPNPSLNKGYLVLEGKECGVFKRGRGIVQTKVWGGGGNGPQS